MGSKLVLWRTRGLSRQSQSVRASPSTGKACSQNNPGWFPRNRPTSIVASNVGSGGHNLDYPQDLNRQMSLLFLSMMDEMDVRSKAFVDATASLEEI